MLNTSRKESIRAAGYKAVLATLLMAVGGAAAADPVAVTLCAKAGASVSPAVPVWGYALGACAAAPAITAPGGPVIAVNAGDVVTVTLDNALAEATGLGFQGQGLASDATGAAAGTTKSYTFTAGRPGTYLYQAAPLANAEHQVAMGLYGALVVRATFDTPVRTDAGALATSGSAVVLDTLAVATDVGLLVSGAGIPAGAKVTAVDPGVSFTMDQLATAGDGATPVAVDFISRKAAAYGAASSAYDDEAIVVLSEIDAGLNTSGNPAAFDMREFGSNALGRGGVPMYYLINGKSYPDTTPIASTAGHTLLIRYVNAGARHHSMGLLGLRQRFIAKDGNELRTADVALTAETLAPGQTGDALVTVPALTTSSQFALYDASLNLHNRDGSANYGGMLTFVSAGTGAAASGPTTSGVTVSPNPTNGGSDVALTAAVATTDAGGVIAVEYFIDTKGADGAGTTMAVATAPNYDATIAAAALAGLSSGNHTFYVHGQDANGWGGYSFAVLNLDKTGPATSALTLTPNPVQPNGTVVLRASASDAGRGGLNVTAAEYDVGDGTGWHAMTLAGVAAPDVSFSATLVAPATSVSRTVHVRSYDQLNNLGPEVTIPLTVAAGGPTTVINTISPNPANGVQGYNTGTPAVRVIATMTGAGANVAGGEAFISACATGCAPGTGIPMVASDGLFNGTPETGYADIPLATIAGMTNGTYTISVRGRDSAGNWGLFATGTLTVNHSAPRVTNVRLNPAYTNASAVQVIANVTDAGTGNNGIAGGEYYIDAIGSPGLGTAMTAASGASTTTLNATIAAGTISGLSEGVHTVFVRARDSAGNWSAVLGAALTIDRTRPNFLGITANGPSPTNAGTVSYTVKFSETVTGVSGADFLVTENLPGNLQVNVSGTGATRTVTVSTSNNNANGTITLSLRSNATITDLAGNNWQNPNNVSLSGPTYTIDKSGPAFSMALSPATVAPGTASTTMNITGATDPAGIAGGVWWIGGNNPPAGGGTPFTVNGSGSASVTIPTDTLALGSYAVRARMTDTLGNVTNHNSTLRVAYPGPAVGAAFAGSLLRSGTLAQRTTTLTITFTNPNAVAITGLGLTNNLPQPTGVGASLSMPSNPATTCGGTVVRQNTNRRFVLSGGTIAANGSCTLTATVVLSSGAGAAAGYTLTDTIAAGAVTSTNADGNASAVSAGLTVTGP